MKFWINQFHKLILGGTNTYSKISCSLSLATQLDGTRPLVLPPIGVTSLNKKKFFLSPFCVYFDALLARTIVEGSPPYSILHRIQSKSISFLERQVFAKPRGWSVIAKSEYSLENIWNCQNIKLSYLLLPGSIANHVAR